MVMTNDIYFPLFLTVLAGLSTGIGSIIAYFIKKPKLIYLSVSLGFAAGVMIYVSFVELFPKAIYQVGEVHGMFAFFLGISFIGIIDLIIPQERNPHFYNRLREDKFIKLDKTLMRTGTFTALAIAIHNFPEGLAIFGTGIAGNLKLASVIALAIAIHNIPEGISISIPIFYASGDRKKAFLYSFFSGIAEPIGAVIGYLVLMPFLSEDSLALMLAFVAGIMVYISLDDLVPMAHRYGQSHIVIFGVILGMLFMGLSMILF